MWKPRDLEQPEGSLPLGLQGGMGGSVVIRPGKQGPLGRAAPMKDMALGKWEQGDRSGFFLGPALPAFISVSHRPTQHGNHLAREFGKCYL